MRDLALRGGLAGARDGLLVVTVVAQAIDNVVRPLLIKKGADLSLLIFPGVIGGLLWLGIIGLFVGPVILAASTLLEGWMSGLGETAPEGAPAVAAGARQTVRIDRASEIAGNEQLFPDQDSWTISPPRANCARSSRACHPGIRA